MMDSETSIKELKDKIKKFCEARDWDQYHNVKDLSIGIATESAELLELFRFKSERDVEAMLKEPKRRNLIEGEIADVFYFLLRLAQKYNIDLAESVERKLKNNEEKYPIEKIKGSNKKYTEL